MSAPSGAHAESAHVAMTRLGLPPVDMSDSGTESSGSLQGILTGVIAGGIIWVAVIALFA